MTYPDDFVVLQFEHGVVRQPCRALGLDWPPPETIEVFGILMRRERLSSITDEQREQMTHVCRGAEYLVEQPPQHDKASAHTGGAATDGQTDSERA